MAAPHPVGAVFSLALCELDPYADGAAANYRAPTSREADATDRELLELAESISELGQLQPVLVAWSDVRWQIAAGYRRARALHAHAAQFGFERIECRAVESTHEDLVRLAENYNRSDPSTFETCRYVFELATGARGRRFSDVAIARAIGASASHVRNLVRFYRHAPESVRVAWAADHDRKFSFRALSDLTRAARGGDESELQRILRRTLGVPSATDDASEEEGRTRGARRLGPVAARGLAERLRAVAGATSCDERVDVALTLLEAVAGKRSATSARELVERLLADLGEVHHAT